MRRPFPDPVTTPDRSEFEYLLRQEAVDRSARHSQGREDRQPFFTEALPCESCGKPSEELHVPYWAPDLHVGMCCAIQDRKSTRLNSSHLGISYAVFCLKKKK